MKSYYWRAVLAMSLVSTMVAASLKIGEPSAPDIFTAGDFWLVIVSICVMYGAAFLAGRESKGD